MINIVRGWLAEAILKFLNEFLTDEINYFSSIINNEFMLTTYIYNIPEINDVINFTVALSYVLLVAVTVKQILDIYGFHTAGDSNESPIEVIYRASISSVLIAASELFYKQFFHFTKNVATDVGTITTSKNLSDQCMTLVSLEQHTYAGVIIVVITLIAIVMLFIISAIRGAQLTLFRILFPVFAIDRSLTNKERWSNFLQSYVACFLGFIIQILCFNLFRLNFMKIGTESANWSFVAAMGWLIMAIKAPAWLEKYVFKSGVGEGLSRAITQAGSILMMRAM